MLDRGLEAEERAAWCMDAVHLLFSGAAAAGAATFVAAAPNALDARWAPPPDSDAAAAADLLACVAAGFYGFQLWALVRHRCALAMWGLFDARRGVYARNYTEPPICGETEGLRGAARGLPKNTNSCTATPCAMSLHK